MVPRTFQFLIAMVVSPIHERAGRRVESLREEVRVETVVALRGKSPAPTAGADWSSRLRIA